MNIQKLTKIINNWDPVGLLAMHAPKDEYIMEIKEIYTVLEKNNNISPETLGIKIREIFSNSFGVDIYEKTDELKIGQMSNN